MIAKLLFKLQIQIFERFPLQGREFVRNASRSLKVGSRFVDVRLLYREEEKKSNLHVCLSWPQTSQHIWTELMVKIIDQCRKLCWVPRDLAGIYTSVKSLLCIAHLEPSQAEISKTFPIYDVHQYYLYVKIASSVTNNVKFSFVVEDVHCRTRK